MVSMMFYNVFQKVVNKWSEAFLTLFRVGRYRLSVTQFTKSTDSRKWAPIGGEVVDRNLVGEDNKDKKVDGLELGMQDMRTYFRLFLLSSVLLLFMFCSRISKSKYRQQIDLQLAQFAH